MKTTSSHRYGQKPNLLYLKDNLMQHFDVDVSKWDISFLITSIQGLYYSLTKSPTNIFNNLLGATFLEWTVFVSLSTCLVQSKVLFFFFGFLIVIYTFPLHFEITVPSPGIRCSKLTIETLEQGVKYVQKLTIKIPERRHLLTLNIFYTLF